MRPAKLHERACPTVFQFWSSIRACNSILIGPDELIARLVKNQAVELLTTKTGGIKCKLINKPKLDQVLQDCCLK